MGNTQNSLYLASYSLKLVLGGLLQTVQGKIYADLIDTVVVFTDNTNIILAPFGMHLWYLKKANSLLD